MKLPVISSPTFMYLRANIACNYLHKSDAEGCTEALLADLNVAEGKSRCSLSPFDQNHVLTLTGGDLQESILAAIIWMCSRSEDNLQAHQRISQDLGELLEKNEAKKVSMRVRHVSLACPHLLSNVHVLAVQYIEVILELISMGLLSEIKGHNVSRTQPKYLMS
jgi:hypothetical protein